MCFNDFLVELERKAKNMDHEYIGRFDLNDGAFGLIQRYETRSFSSNEWENHRDYIDVHFLLMGREIIGVCKTDDLALRVAYDKTNDVVFYYGYGYSTVLVPGKFVVIKPGEAHQPGLIYGQTTFVRKVVGKYPIKDC